jgi:hypothetical protein
MIEIVQWRARGLLKYYCNLAPNGVSGYGKCLIKLCSLTILIVLLLVLILSGDIELNPGPKTDVKPELLHLMKLLAEIAPQYSDIGTALNVPMSSLGLIASPDTHRDNLRRTLEWWINNGATVGSPITYDNIIDAIKGPIVQNFRVSENIREFYEQLKEGRCHIPKFDK